MESTAVQAAYSALQMELEETKSNITALARALQDPARRSSLEQPLPSTQEINRTLERNLHAANSTVKHLGLELLLKDRRISELSQRLSASGESRSDSPDQRRTSSDSQQASRMQVYCADLAQRCQALEGMFERLQSDSGHQRLSTPGAAMQLDYQVTVTSPSREASSSASFGGLPDAASALSGEAGPGRSPTKGAKPLGHTARRSSEDRGSGSWRISTHADLLGEELSRGSLGSLHGPAEDNASQSSQLSDRARPGPQLAAAVRKIARLEDHLAESRGQTALLLQQVSGLHEDHDLLASMHDTLESQVVDLSSMQARLVEAQQQLAVSQQACHAAIAEGAQEHAGRVHSEEQVQRLQAELLQSRQDCARLQARMQTAEPAADDRTGQAMQGSVPQLDVQAASEAARQVMQILAGICTDGPSEEGHRQQADQAEPDLLTLQDQGVNLAYEAASLVSKLRWQVGYRSEEMEKRLARFSSVEAKCFGMEEDMAAVLADMSQIHNQLLAAEHANTELLGRQSGDHGPRDRDMLESISRLEHQLKASGSSIQELEAQLAEATAASEQAQRDGEDMRAALREQQRQTQSLEACLQQAERPGTNSHMLAELQRRLEGASQWGLQLEVKCSELQQENMQLQQQVSIQRRESGVALMDAQAALQMVHGRQGSSQDISLPGLFETSSPGEEVALLKAQLQLSQQLIGQLQASLRAKGRAAEISSPSIAAQERAVRHSAGEVLRSAVHSIEDCIREQSAEQVSSVRSRRSHDSSSASEAASDADQLASPASSQQGIMLPLVHSPVRTTTDSELSDLSDVESRPGSAPADSLRQDSDISLSFQPAFGASDNDFGRPALNPLYAGSPTRLSEAAEEPPLPQAAPAAAFEHMLAQQRGSEQLEQDTSTASSVSLASCYATPDGAPPSNLAKEPAVLSENQQSSLPLQVPPQQPAGWHEAGDEPLPVAGVGMHDAQSFAGFQAANPLYGAGSSMAMFQSGEWGQTMQGHQLGDSFRPVPHETNPLFARWHSNLPAQGACIIEELDESAYLQDPPAQARGNTPPIKATQPAKWAEIVDESSSEASTELPVPADHEVHQEHSFEQLPDGERWQNRGVELETSQQQVAHLQAELAELRARSQASGRAMNELQLEMQGAVDGCTAAEERLEALQHMAQAAASERDAARRDCQALQQRCDQLPSAAEQAAAQQQADGPGSPSNELSAAKRRCRALEAELQSLHDFYANADEDKRILQQRCARLEEALVEVTEPLNAANAEVETLRMQCEQLDAALAEAEDQMQDATTISTAMQERFVQAEHELAGTRQQAASLQAAVASQQDMPQTAALQAKALELEQQLARAEAEAAGMQADAAHAQAEVARLEDERRQSQAEVIQIQEALAQSQSRFDDVAANLSKTREENAQLQRPSAEATTAYDQLQSQLEQARDDSAKLQRECQRAQADATSTRQRLQDLQQATDTARQQATAAQEQAVQQAQDENSHAQARISELTTELATAEQRARELAAGHADAEQLREAVHSAHEQKQALNRHLQETQRELLALAGLLEQSLHEKRRLERAASDTAGASSEHAALAAQVDQGHRELAELQQHLNSAFQERSALQGALQEAHAGAAQLQAQLAEAQEEAHSRGEQLEQLSTTHAEVTQQLGRADAEMGEDLLAAQEQMQELSEQLQAAVREIQDRQAELRRVNEQAAGLADELAQSQHQAELEQQHAQHLQSEAISSKLRLMQEVERLKRELEHAAEAPASTEPQEPAQHQPHAHTPESRSLHTSTSTLAPPPAPAATPAASRSLQTSTSTLDAGAATKPGRSLHYSTTTLSPDRQMTPDSRSMHTSTSALSASQHAASATRSMQTSTSSLQTGAVQLLQRLTQDQEQPGESLGERAARASLQELAQKLPSMTKQLSSRTSAPLAWGEDLLWSAIEAEDDRALLRLLDQRCSDMAVQRERDEGEITDLTARVAELQSDLEACLATLQRDHVAVAALAHMPAPSAGHPQAAVDHAGPLPAAAHTTSARTGDRTADVQQLNDNEHTAEAAFAQDGAIQEAEEQAQEPVRSAGVSPQSSSSNAAARVPRLSLQSGTSAQRRLSAARAGGLPEEDEKERLCVLVARLQAQLQARDAKIRSLQGELTSIASDSSLSSSANSSSNAVSAPPKRHSTSGVPQKSATSAPIRRAQSAQPSQELGQAGRSGSLPRPSSTLRPRSSDASKQQAAIKARAEAAEARANSLQAELRTVSGQLQVMQRATGIQIKALQHDLATQNKPPPQQAQSGGEGSLKHPQSRPDLLRIGEDTDSSDEHADWGATKHVAPEAAFNQRLSLPLQSTTRRQPQGLEPKAGTGRLPKQLSLPGPGQRLQALIAARRTARGQGGLVMSQSGGQSM